MIDARTATILQGVVRREGRSLLQYVHDSFPWTQTGNQEMLTKIQALVEEERAATAALARFLIEQRFPPPYLGAYPTGFTTINYVSLESLLPRLLDFQKEAVAALQRDLAEVTDADARKQLLGLLEMKQRHLETLESLAAAHPQPALR
jgi:hypothetical protein